MTQCPKCGYENPDSVMNCKNCRINLEFAIANPEQVKIAMGLRDSKSSTGQRCDRCRQLSYDLVEYEWIAGKEIRRTHLGTHIRVTYTNIHSLPVRLCEECFRDGLSTHRRSLLKLVPVAAVLVPVLFYALTKLDSILPGDRSSRKLSGILVFLAILLIFGGALMVLIKLLQAFVPEPRGNSIVKHILHPYLDAKLKASGATHFWTRSEFERIRNEQESEL